LKFRSKIFNDLYEFDKQKSSFFFGGGGCQWIKYVVTFKNFVFSKSEHKKKKTKKQKYTLRGILPIVNVSGHVGFGGDENASREAFRGSPFLSHGGHTS